MLPNHSKQTEDHVQQLQLILSEPGPFGFQYQAEFLKHDEEVQLRDFFSGLELRPFEFRGFTGNRRVVSYGLRYDFVKHSVEPAAPIPELLQSFLPRVAAFADIRTSDIVQVGINEYGPSVGIGWHRDKPQFGYVIGISIGGLAKMRFRLRTLGEWERRSVTLEPRSIYLLSGPSRSEWEHSIPPVESLRYSVTFRTAVKRSA